jgi:hypothetical protein
MAALRTAREKLLAIGSEHANEKQVKALADAEASLLARLIVANARMQCNIFKLLSPDQQKKLIDLERKQSEAHHMVGGGAITAKCRLEAARVTADVDSEMVMAHSLGITSLKKLQPQV